MKNYVNYLWRIKLDYKQCNRCVMDTTAEDIFFDVDGNCNYCRDFLESIDKGYSNLSSKLDSFISQVKKDGQGKKYDCIVGVSGGADSSYSLYLAKKYGLRVLAVHMDNGWNSELATNNIETLISNMGVDLYTHVIDWNEYKQLMQAFFDADVIDVELLYDNAMLALNYQMAAKYGVKYILSGSNSSTEGIKIPSNWNWYKKDKKNIKSLAKRNKVKIKTYPSISTLDYLYFRGVKKIQWIPFLDYVDYNKNEAMTFLKDNYGFKPYPYKHYESIFTRFYQGYILPKKFKVDKRKVHFSTLIISKQLNKENALKFLEQSPYSSQYELDNDIEYFLKKMSWTEIDLENYINRDEKQHKDYGTEVNIFIFLKQVYNKLK